MGLLGGGGDSAETCDVCGKDVGDGPVTDDEGNTFCCEECKNHYEDEEKSDEKEEVCEFC